MPKTLPVTAKAALAAFRRYLGIGEHPSGSNKNAITAWYGAVGPWCAMTVSKVLADIGVLKQVLGRVMSYTVDIYERGKKMGWLIDPHARYEPGDIVLFNFGDPHWGGRPLGIHHVGMAIVDLGGGKFASYEGNTGDDCLKRVRSKNNVAAVVRPPWAQAGASKPAASTKPASKPAKPRQPLVRLGSHGGAVKTLQSALNKAGAKLAVDGVFGPKTLNAVRSYQSAHHLAVDGIVGPKTWGSLGY